MLKSMTIIDASLYFIVCCWGDTGKIILNRFHEHPDQAEILPEIQCVFRKGREEMILPAGHLQEKYQKTVDWSTLKARKS